MEAIVIWALAAATLAKVGVDLVRMAIEPLPKWASPLLAVLFGIGVVLGLMLAETTPLTAQTIAIAILSGLLAGGTAVGVTEISRRT